MEHSGWLDFLRRAQGITLECLAKRHGIRRSNISAFVTSLGEKKNISFEKARSILFDLGVLIDGVLLPGVHCWRIDIGMVTRLHTLLSINNYERLFLFELTGRPYNKVVFMVAQISNNTFIFVEFCWAAAQSIRTSLSKGVKNILLDRPEWIALHEVWGDRKVLQDRLVDKLKKILEKVS